MHLMYSQKNKKMSYSEKLKQKLKFLAERIAKNNQFPSSNTQHKSAFIFDCVKHNFHRRSYENIEGNKNWQERLDKPHSQLKGYKEMQSSNSSDALLMNIFCHPDINKWKGIAKLFDLSNIKEVTFGHNPKLLKNGKPESKPHQTEIDLVINDKIICEAKLTESDFTNKNKKSVEAYDRFEGVFNKHYLTQTHEEYSNYQLIRNILSLVHYSAFFLICDARRPDLVKNFYETIRCINDISLRAKCNIIFWQDIAKSVGKDLRDYLKISYNL
ncbi:hypothetical protein ES708_03776 [subsurface metagenome]